MSVRYSLKEGGMAQGPGIFQNPLGLFALWVKVKEV